MASPLATLMSVWQPISVRICHVVAYNETIRAFASELKHPKNIDETLLSKDGTYIGFLKACESDDIHTVENVLLDPFINQTRIRFLLSAFDGLAVKKVNDYKSCNVAGFLLRLEEDSEQRIFNSSERADLRRTDKETVKFILPVGWAAPVRSF